MTTFNTNVTSGLGGRTTIGPTKIRSCTRYSDMFVGAQNDVIESMLEGNQARQQESNIVKPAHHRKTTSGKNLSRYERLTKLRNDHLDIQTIPDVHYRVIESIPDALNAAVELANYHSISVLWEGFDVNRHGTLTWIICGYLGSAVLFNVRKLGAKIFTEGGLKTLLEARHPIKVIHDCSCLADILFYQYSVELKAESIFDTHAADLLIQNKTSQELTAKTLSECLIEYQDIPVSVYRQRDNIMRRDPGIWVRDNVPPELLLLTARLARYAVLLYGIMLRELSKPLPQITEIYLNYRTKEKSPDPKTRIREIPPDVETLLIKSKHIPVMKTEWHIPETVLNPVYETLPGDEHFYSKPFKFDPKKATPGSLKIFSVNPNRPPVEDDNDWEKYVHGAPRYGPVEEQEEEEAEEEVREEDHPLEGDLFKVPDIFSDVTSSSEGYQGDVGETSRDAEQEPVINVDRVWRSNSSSEDNINVIVPECEPPPTVAATMDPSLLGSKMIYAGDPRYNDPNHQAPVMSPELRALVEKIRAEKKSEPRSRAFITAEEMRRNLDEERREFLGRYTPEPDEGSIQSSEVAKLTEKTDIMNIIEPHYEIVSSSSSSSDVIVEQNDGFSAFPKFIVKEPISSAIQTSPRQPHVQTTPSTARLQSPAISNNSMKSQKTDKSLTSDPKSTPPPLVQASSLIVRYPQKSSTSNTISPQKSPTALKTTLSMEYNTERMPFTSHNAGKSRTGIVMPSENKNESNSSGKVTNYTKTGEKAPEIPKFSDMTTSFARSHSSSSGSGSKRQPLIIIPKSRVGRGRSNPQNGTFPPPLVSSISQPQSTNPCLPKGRGRAAAIANRTVSRDFSAKEQSSLPPSPASSGSFYHSDFYGAGVTVCPDTLEQEEGGPNFRSSSSARGSSTWSQKLPVSLCFAYDSDDPDSSDTDL